MKKRSKPGGREPDVIATEVARGTTSEKAEDDDLGYGIRARREFVAKVTGNSDTRRNEASATTRAPSATTQRYQHRRESITTPESYQAPDDNLSPKRAFPRGKKIFVVNMVTPVGRKFNEGDRKDVVTHVEYKQCRRSKVEMRVWFTTLNGVKTYRFPKHLRVLSVE